MIFMENAFDGDDIIPLSALSALLDTDEPDGAFSTTTRSQVAADNVNVNEYFYAVVPSCDAIAQRSNRPACPMTMCSGVGQLKGGANAEGTRYCYLCLDCGTAWNQLRPSLLAAGGDAMIDLNCRRAFASDATVRSGGYSCRRCGRKKNKKRVAPGELPCLCSKRSTAHKRSIPDGTFDFAGPAKTQYLGQTYECRSH